VASGTRATGAPWIKDLGNTCSDRQCYRRINRRPLHADQEKEESTRMSGGPDQFEPEMPEDVSALVEDDDDDTVTEDDGLDAADDIEDDDEESEQ
jgi:hypothetical protein